MLDHCYTAVCGAYRAVPHTAVGLSEQVMIYLIHAYTQTNALET